MTPSRWLLRYTAFQQTYFSAVSSGQLKSMCCNGKFVVFVRNMWNVFDFIGLGWLAHHCCLFASPLVKKMNWGESRKSTEPIPFSIVLPARVQVTQKVPSDKFWQPKSILIRVDGNLLDLAPGNREDKRLRWFWIIVALGLRSRRCEWMLAMVKGEWRSMYIPIRCLVAHFRELKIASVWVRANFT